MCIWQKIKSLKFFSSPPSQYSFSCFVKLLLFIYVCEWNGESLWINIYIFFVFSDSSWLNFIWLHAFLNISIFECIFFVCIFSFSILFHLSWLELIVLNSEQWKWISWMFAMAALQICVWIYRVIFRNNFWVDGTDSWNFLLKLLWIIEIKKNFKAHLPKNTYRQCDNVTPNVNSIID